MKQHKWHKEIVAWANGAEIEGREQYEDGSVGEWHRLYDPTFSANSVEYRIKPQPKEPQYLYVYDGYGKQQITKSRTAGILCNIGDKQVMIPCIGKIKLEEAFDEAV